MADVAPTRGGGRISGQSINVTGTACDGDVTGDWITPLHGAVVSGLCLEYSEAGGGTMTQAVITLQVKVAGDATIYSVTPVDFTAWNYTCTTTGKYYLPIAPKNASTAAAQAPLEGIDAIRATATITGTGATTDVVRVTFVGRESIWASSVA